MQKLVLMKKTIIALLFSAVCGSPACLAGSVPLRYDPVTKEAEDGTLVLDELRTGTIANSGTSAELSNQGVLLLSDSTAQLQRVRLGLAAGGDTTGALLLYGTGGGVTQWPDAGRSTVPGSVLITGSDYVNLRSLQLLGDYEHGDYYLHNQLFPEFLGGSRSGLAENTGYFPNYSLCDDSNVGWAIWAVSGEAYHMMTGTTAALRQGGASGMFPSGQVNIDLTSDGSQTASSANSYMTRRLVEVDRVMSRSVLPINLAQASIAYTGSAAVAYQTNFGGTMYLCSGTSAGTYARATITPYFGLDTASRFRFGTDTVGLALRFIRSGGTSPYSDQEAIVWVGNVGTATLDTRKKGYGFKLRRTTTNAYEYKILARATDAAATVTNSGTGYTAATVAFSGGGSPSVVMTGSVTVASGTVSAVTILTAGKDYTEAPALAISGDGANATAAAATGMITTETAWATYSNATNDQLMWCILEPDGDVLLYRASGIDDGWTLLGTLAGGPTSVSTAASSNQVNIGVEAVGTPTGSSALYVQELKMTKNIQP